jgi:hypothetical protein
VKSWEAHRLSGIGDFGLQEVVEATIDLVRNRVQQLAALREVHPSPRTGKRGACCAHCGVHL